MGVASVGPHVKCWQVVLWETGRESHQGRLLGGALQSAQGALRSDGGLESLRPFLFDGCADTCFGGNLPPRAWKSLGASSRGL